MFQFERLKGNDVQKSILLNIVSFHAAAQQKQSNCFSLILSANNKQNG